MLLFRSNVHPCTYSRATPSMVTLVRSTYTALRSDILLTKLDKSCGSEV